MAACCINFTLLRFTFSTSLTLSINVTGTQDKNIVASLTKDCVSKLTDDCLVQCWFRFLHILSNPVDLCRIEVISETPKFLHHALTSEKVRKVAGKIKTVERVRLSCAVFIVDGQ